MKEIRLKTENETLEEQTAAGRYNPALVAIYRVKTPLETKTFRFSLRAGHGDDLSFFVDSQSLYVVSVHHGLGYAGLQVFNITGEYIGEESGSVFCQSDHEVREKIGAKGIDYHPRTIAKRLAEYC